MPNKSYQRGVSFERKVMDIFAKLGWYASRAAGSHGKFDVIAWNTKRLRFIQCKTTLSKIRLRAYLSDLREMAKTPVPDNAVKELWIKHGRTTERILLIE